MRILTWNVCRATSQNLVWKMLLEIAPDIALLQEVGGFSKKVQDQYKIRFQTAMGKTGRPQQFGTGVLVRGNIVDGIKLVSEYSWVNEEISFFSRNLVGCVVAPENDAPKNMISVYSPAWPVDKKRLSGIDVSSVKLDNSPDV